LRPRAAPTLAGTLVIALSGCQQTDQQLPFALDEGVGQTASIGINGGLISVPPNFSIQFLTGSLPGTTQVTAATRFTAFPSIAGVPIPGSTFDVGPAGMPLSTTAPARVQIAVPAAILGAGDELRLAVALLRSGGAVVTGVTSYDIANGIVTADVYEVGPVAAVVSLDAIAVQDLAAIPALGGGSIAPPSLAAVPVGAAQAPGDPVFSAECSGESRNCLTSGIVQLWVDPVVRERLGEQMVLLNTEVSGSIEFLDFDLSGRPTRITGYIEIEGELRARLNNVVAGRRVGQDLVIHTGSGTTPSPTDVTFSGNVMTLAETSEGPNESMVYGVTGIGTGEQFTLRMEREIEFRNSGNQPSSYGRIVAHVRLRR
jgi:hypothetical protein